ncbi:MAG: hypothetical protein OEN20_01480 [Gammaproteobacteria bacterium]|nr:hypothetical protein [Gammaproteobacteria bacterium]
MSLMTTETQPMLSAFTKQDLDDENLAYSGTLGVSTNNAARNFLPAFQDAITGETHLSMNNDGTPAMIHLLDHLPTEWVLAKDGDGRVLAVKDSVVAGFVRDGRFFTRAELAAKTLDS